MNKQKPTWLAITALPEVSQIVAMLLQDTEEMYPLFVEAREKPWTLDNATVDRTIRLYRERLDILAIHEEQFSRWRKEHTYSRPGVRIVALTRCGKQGT